MNLSNTRRFITSNFFFKKLHFDSFGDLAIHWLGSSFTNLGYFE